MTNRISMKKFSDTLWCNFALKEDYALDCLQEVPEDEIQKIEITHFITRFLCSVCAEKLKQELKPKPKPDAVEPEPKPKKSFKQMAQDVEEYLIMYAPTLYLSDIKQNLKDLFDLSLTNTGIRLRLKKIGVNHKLRNFNQETDTKELIVQYLQLNENKKIAKDLRDDLEKLFDIKISTQSVREYCRRHKIKIIKQATGKKKKELK